MPHGSEVRRTGRDFRIRRSPVEDLRVALAAAGGLVVGLAAGWLFFHRASPLGARAVSPDAIEALPMTNVTVNPSDFQSMLQAARTSRPGAAEALPNLGATPADLAATPLDETAEIGRALGLLDQLRTGDASEARRMLAAQVGRFYAARRRVLARGQEQPVLVVDLLRRIEAAAREDPELTQALELVGDSAPAPAPAPTSP